MFYKNASFFPETLLEVSDFIGVLEINAKKTRLVNLVSLVVQ